MNPEWLLDTRQQRSNACLDQVHHDDESVVAPVVGVRHLAITEEQADRRGDTDRPQRPLRVIHARRRPTYTGSDVPIDIEAHKEYFDQPQKSSSGSMNFVYYKPELVSGRLYIWQRPSTVKELLGITVERALADMDDTDDEPDFPIEWQLPLVTNLAKMLEPQYGQLDGGRRAELRQDADRMYLEAQLGDAEMESMYIRPSRYRRR